jgi:hypothetical protein
MTILIGSRKYYMKKPKTDWRNREGKLIPVDRMTDSHLINAIRMVARTWHKSHPGKIPPTENYQMLYQEAKKRRMQIKLLTSPIQVNGKTEWIDIYVLPAQCKLAPGFIPSELDSRNEI